MPLHTLSNGIPRQILTNSENICRLAFKANKSKVDKTFILETYDKEFEKEYKNLIKEQCYRLSDFKKGLEILYVFYADIERKNLETGEANDYLMRILSGEKKLSEKDIRVSYRTAVNYISIQDIKNGKIVRRITPEIKTVFKELTKKGYGYSDFVSFYSSFPLFCNESEEDIKDLLKNYDYTSEDVEYYNEAKRLYLEIGKKESAPYVFIKTSYTILENIIVAILIKSNKLTKTKYEYKMSTIYRTDHYGQQRYVRGAGQLLSDISYWLKTELKEALKENNIYMNTLSDFEWIRSKRRSVIKGNSEMYLNYTSEEKDLCRRHLKKTFQELLEIYDRIDRTE